MSQGQGTVPMPGRSQRHWWIGGIVVIAVAALLLWSGRAALLPAAEVVVRPVVLVEQPAGVDDTARHAGGEHVAAASGSRAGPAAGGRIVQAAGWVEPEPYPTIVYALTDGTVGGVEVLEGDRVEVGQRLAYLTGEDQRMVLASREGDLVRARAEVEAAKARLAEAQERWDNPIEAERAVATARAELAEVEAELAQLPSLIDTEKSLLDSLEEEFTRSQQAQKTGAASELEVVKLAKSKAAQAARVLALERSGPILEAKRDRLRAELRAAERHLELRIEDKAALELAKVAVEAAMGEMLAIKAMRDHLFMQEQWTRIVSPIDGYVMRRLKDPGDKVMRGMDDPESAQLFWLYDPTKLQVRVDVPLADVGAVRIGQPCEVIVEAAPDSPLAGEVIRITNEADLQKNTLEVKVRLLETNPVVRPEMLARVRFGVGVDGGASDAARGTSGRWAPADTAGAAAMSEARVPESAVIGADGSASVRRVVDRRGARGRVEVVAVDVVKREAGEAIVRSVLHHGDLVVVGGDRVADGERVVMTIEGGGEVASAAAGGAR